ncbi:MAG: hypothetical protein ACFBSF_10065 [Leptolyngbyaceae cyanobacterium]
MEIQLLRVRDGQTIDASLLPLNDQHLSDFETFWKNRLLSSDEEDAYWDWNKKNRLYASDANYEKYAITCQQITQGLMMLEARGHRSWFEPNRRLVYVDYLATAPWNRPSIQNPPEYRSVGGILLKFARHRSEELGYGGLVGLHALPRAKKFYDKMGMIDCGEDPEKQNLTYFEWYRQRPPVTELVEQFE